MPQFDDFWACMHMLHILLYRYIYIFKMAKRNADPSKQFLFFFWNRSDSQSRPSMHKFKTFQKREKNWIATAPTSNCNSKICCIHLIRYTLTILLLLSFLIWKHWRMHKAVGFNILIRLSNFGIDFFVICWILCGASMLFKDMHICTISIYVVYQYPLLCQFSIANTHLFFLRMHGKRKTSHKRLNAFSLAVLWAADAAVAIISRC